MELRHLRYFAALAERLNFTRAAEWLHVSQSTLSHQIQQLEEELGTSLFERNAKRVKLTPEGELFLASALQALESVDTGVRNLKEPTPVLTGEVRIGMTPSLAAALVPDCVVQLVESHPSVRVVINEMTTEEVRAGLLAGELDLGIAYLPLETKGLSFEPLFEEEMVVMVHATHPLAGKRRIRLVDLHLQRMVLPTHHFSIRDTIDGYFRAAGAEPQIVVEADSFATTFLLIERLGLAAIVPRSVAAGAPGCRSIPIEKPFAARTPSLFLRRGARLTPPARELAQMLRTEAARRYSRKHR